MAVAADILAGYAALDDPEKRIFFEGLRECPLKPGACRSAAGTTNGV